jgi:hypothetical protein
MAEAIVEASVRATGEAARVWGAAGISAGDPGRSLGGRAAPVRPATISAWLSAEDVALLILRGECAEAGISVPARFSPQAVVSAVSSVERWTREGRIFAIHDLYPRYQFDGRGRPHASVERVLSVLCRNDPLRVGNWFATANPYLGGKRPQEMLSTAPAFVILALLKSVQQFAG